MGPVNDFAEAFDDPQIRHRQMVVEEESDLLGRWTHVGNPIKMRSSDDDLVRRPPPELGEHTVETLRALGIDEEGEGRLRAAGAI